MSARLQFSRMALGWVAPDAMWFCFFSSSVSLGFSSAPWPLALLSLPGEADLDGDDIKMKKKFVSEPRLMEELTFGHQTL